MRTTFHGPNPSSGWWSGVDRLLRGVLERLLKGLHSYRPIVLEIDIKFCVHLGNVAEVLIRLWVGLEKLKSPVEGYTSRGTEKSWAREARASVEKYVVEIIAQVL